jgi:hypothetical protein
MCSIFKVQVALGLAGNHADHRRSVISAVLCHEVGFAMITISHRRRSHLFYTPQLLNLDSPQQRSASQVRPGYSVFTVLTSQHTWSAGRATPQRALIIGAREDICHGLLIEGRFPSDNSRV